MSNNQRYKSALHRNANEICRALLELRVMNALEEANTSHSIDFIRLAYDAIFNDYISHAIKVFEDSEVSSFWYLKRCKEKVILDFCSSQNIDISVLDKIKHSLRTVRNKTHFHIDRHYVKNSHKAWQDADLTGKELASGMQIVWDIVDHLYTLEFSESFRFPEYDDKDAIRAAKLVETFHKNF